VRGGSGSASTRFTQTTTETDLYLLTSEIEATLSQLADYQAGTVSV
jgi:hypothetical protein